MAEKLTDLKDVLVNSSSETSERMELAWDTDILRRMLQIPSLKERLGFPCKYT